LTTQTNVNQNVELTSVPNGFPAYRKPIMQGLGSILQLLARVGTGSGNRTENLKIIFFEKQNQSRE
jgi:hypothetical protein